jgi:hypothetical protein
MPDATAPLRHKRACSTLGLWWVVVPGAGYPAALRLAHDAAGIDLVLTAEEAKEARIRELEAKLAARSQ